MANNPPISSKVCRLCLTKDQDVNLGDKISKEKKYWQVMTSFTNIKYSPNDGLPQSICRMCASQLSNIHIFKQRCEASHETLLANFTCDTKIEYLEERSIPEFSTVIIKEEDMGTDDFHDGNVKVESEEEEIEYLLEEKDMSDDEEVKLKKRVREKRHQCTECGVMVESPSKLVRHLRTHAFNNQMIVHGTDTGKVYSCKHCSVTFLKMKQLRYHLSGRCKKMQKKKASERQEDSEEDTENEEALKDSESVDHPDGFKCHVCSASCNTLESLRSHMRMYHAKYGNLLMSCCGCSFTHESSSDLIEHYRVSQACTDKANCGEKSSSYSCEICGKEFRYKSCLKKHTISHSGEKHFECDICFKRFTRKGQIVVHKRMHFNIRPFMCQDCGMAFRKSSDLQRHRRIHTGEANYECLICLRRFKWDTALKVHMSSHTGERPYKCQHCPKAYTCRSGLKKHIAHHVQVEGESTVIARQNPKRSATKSRVSTQS